MSAHAPASLKTPRDLRVADGGVLDILAHARPRHTRSTCRLRFEDDPRARHWIGIGNLWGPGGSEKDRDRNLRSNRGIDDIIPQSCQVFLQTENQNPISDTFWRSPRPRSCATQHTGPAQLGLRIALPRPSRSLRRRSRATRAEACTSARENRQRWTPSMIIDTIKVASNLTSAEKKLDYEAEATEYVPSHRFPKKGERPAMTCAALKSLCKNIRENTHVRTIVYTVRQNHRVYTCNVCVSHRACPPERTIIWYVVGG